MATLNSSPSALDSPTPNKLSAGAAFIRLLNVVILILLVIAASIAATLYYTGKATDFPFWSASAQSSSESTYSTENTKNATSTKPIFTALDPFTVTLSDATHTRILHVAITLRVENDESRRLLHEFMPMVRDRILKTLSAQDPFRVQTPEGRESLVSELVQTLSVPFEPNPTPARIANVLFTAFVIQ